MQERQAGSLTYGFIGLGNMGGPMSARLQAAGYRLMVFDIDERAVARVVDKGAAAASSVTEVADGADVVFVSLPRPEVVREVAVGDGGLIGGRRVKTVVDLSTTGPKVSEEIGRELEAAGKRLLDCPVSGGPAGAEKGTLALMLAGAPEARPEVEPCLAHFGRHFVVGDAPGQGQTLKIINNLMSTAALAISSEALVLGVKAGLDPDIMIEAINAGSGRNSATLDKVPKHVLTRSFDFGFPIALSTKDARLCLEEADRLGVPMVVGSAVRQLLNITRDHLGGDSDLTSVIRVVEQWAKVEVRGKASAPRETAGGKEQAG